jgi:hypothetical protein
MQFVKQIKKEPLLLLFGLTWVIKIIHSNLNFSPLKVTDPDGYFVSFQYFIDHGYYSIIANGSSYLFNWFNYIFYLLIDNVSISFFITNALSELFLIIIGLKIIRLINTKYNSKYLYVIIAIYIFNTLDLNDYQHSNNDVFQAVFIALIVMYLVKQYLSKSINYKYYFYISLLSVLCTLIRPTSLVVIVMVLSSVIILEYLRNSNSFQVLKSFGIVAIPIFILISILHYPALREKNTLGFYNKSTDSENWVQRNYLATKRIQKGELPLHKNSIFRATKFNKVNDYLAINGENSLPKSQGEFLKKDPILSGIIFSYNIIFTFLKASRYYAFLIVLPLLLLVFKPFRLKEKFYIYISGIIIGVLSFIPFTLMEYRWYTGYDILFILSIFSAIHYFEKSKYQYILKYSIKSSLIIISIFNVLLTFVIGSSY